LIAGGEDLNPQPQMEQMMEQVMELMLEQREGRGINEWSKNNKSSLDTMSVKVDHKNETTKIHGTVKGAKES
jgi:hypothetical protein